MRYFVKTPALLRLLFRNVLWQKEEDNKVIYLTFDDGPDRLSTPKLLSLLQKLELKATFFWLGNKVQYNRALYNTVLNEGHIIGNHSFGHLDAWKTTHEEYLKDVELASKLIDTKLFRPPYGRLKWRDYQVLKKKYKIVMWTVMPGDWEIQSDRELLLSRMKEHLSPGQVYVLHDNDLAFHKLQFYLPLFVSYARERGYSFGII